MNLDDSTLAVFHRDGWEAGIRVMCGERAQKALRARMKAFPGDAVENAKAMREFEIFNTELPSIAQQLEEFRAQQAPAKGTP